MKKKPTEIPGFSVGKRITELREKLGYSTNKLANKAGISQSYLRDVEQNNKNPTIEFLYLICQPLGISLKDFFKDETSAGLPDEDLIQKVRQLSDRQREALLHFLDTMEA